MKIIDLKQDTQEWLNYRKEKFNASQTAELFGVGFYGKESKAKDILANVKYGNLKPYQSQKMADGINAETEIRQYAEMVTGLNFTPCVGVLETDERFSASLDGFNAEANIILEIKHSKIEFDYIAKHEKPSEKYYLQVQHQLLVSGADMCYFFVQNSESKEINYLIIYPNFETMAKIKEQWENFELLYKNEIPPLEIEIPKELENDITKLKKLNAKLKDLQSKISDLKEKIGSSLDFSGCDKVKGYGVSICKTETKTYDYKGFLADNNLEISAKYAKVSQSLRFTFNKE